MILQNALKKITWEDILELHLCKHAVRWAQKRFSPTPETRLLEEHLECVRKYNSFWADQLLFKLAYMNKKLTPEERFTLAKEIRSPYCRLDAGWEIKELTVFQALDLAKDCPLAIPLMPYQIFKGYTLQQRAIMIYA